MKESLESGKNLYLLKIFQDENNVKVTSTVDVSFYEMFYEIRKGFRKRKKVK